MAKAYLLLDPEGECCAYAPDDFEYLAERLADEPGSKLFEVDFDTMRIKEGVLDPPPEPLTYKFKDLA